MVITEDKLTIEIDIAYFILKDLFVDTQDKVAITEYLIENNLDKLKFRLHKQDKILKIGVRIKNIANLTCIMDHIDKIKYFCTVTKRHNKNNNEKRILRLIINCIPDLKNENTLLISNKCIIKSVRLTAKDIEIIKL